MNELKTNQSHELIFVYNARSGFFSKVTDFAHKIISPATYACNLCGLTYGTFEMQQEWKDFLQDLPYKVSFHYKDRSKDLQKYGEAPLLMLKQGGETTVLLSAEEINIIQSLSELMKSIRMKIGVI